jgi:hypothetical protein
METALAANLPMWAEGKIFQKNKEIVRLPRSPMGPPIPGPQLTRPLAFLLLHLLSSSILSTSATLVEVGIFLERRTPSA